ncbi:MAG: ABC transporter ATP-binding protein [Byssovorax sp.]
MAEAEPLLVADQARIAVDGAVAIDRLTLATRGDRVLFAGDAGALFAAVTQVPLSARIGALAASPTARPLPRGPREDEDAPLGEASVVAGSLRLAGHEVSEDRHLAVMGAAPLDPPIPARWTAEEYLRWGARLGGATARQARELAPAVLARMGLGASRAKLGSALSLPERRALVLAQAVVLSPEVLVAEAPLEGLEGAAAAFVMQAIGRASEGRRVLLSAARLDPGSAEGALAREASQVLVMAGGALALEGTPAELFSGATVVSLTVTRNADALRAELGARGLDLRGGAQGGARFSVILPAGMGTRELLLAAQTARAAVIEMVPLIG